MKGYVVCVYKNISNEEKLKEYALKAKIADIDTNQKLNPIDNDHSTERYHNNS